MIIKIILIALMVWILFAIILPFLILPNFFLREQKPQKTKEIEKIAKKLKKKEKEKTLRSIYNYVIKNYDGYNKKYKLANYLKLFQANVGKNLEKSQFLVCHLQNLIIRDLLLNTGQFTKEDFKQKFCVTKFLTGHQYLIINTGEEKFYVDPFYRKFEKLK
jgi:hypothetical protein